MRPGAPSRTAGYMAFFRALESLEPADRRLVDDQQASLFLTARLRALVRLAGFAPARRLLIAYVDRRWPGPRLSGVVRTHAIDELVRRAIREGCGQLVLLGAGYDTRATRLPEARSIPVFEIDHPDTQSYKREALAATPANVCYVPLDFERDSLAQALAHTGLDRAKRSCVVWEGVFSYLSADAIDVTLASLIRACAPGSRLILTYVDEGALEGSQAEPWVAAVRKAGEPFRTGLDPSAAASFFGARGLTLLCDETTTQAAARLPVAHPERIPPFYRLASLAIGLQAADAGSVDRRG